MKKIASAVLIAAGIGAAMVGSAGAALAGDEWNSNEVSHGDASQAGQQDAQNYEYMPQGGGDHVPCGQPGNTCTHGG